MTVLEKDLRVRWHGVETINHGKRRYIGQLFSVDIEGHLVQVIYL